MLLPAFGPGTFFNQELFDYVLMKAAEDPDGLHREVHAWAREFGHQGWDIQIRADQSPPSPSINLRVLTPTVKSEICIANKIITHKALV